MVVQLIVADGVHLLAKSSGQEVGHNFIHLSLGHGGDAALLLDLLPFGQVGLLQVAHSLGVVGVELVLVEFGHDPET